jgi:putative transposase
MRLFEASRRFSGISLLNYVITSNHVHILAWAPRLSNVSAMMHWLQGAVAQDFNRRTTREGSFWRGRFQPTLVQSGEHLGRCLIYLDLNMVRAGMVLHPSEWRFGGHQELSGIRQRYRCLDQEKLREFIGIPSPDRFRQWYRESLDQRIRQGILARESYWSTAFAVGDRAWLERISQNDPSAIDYIRPCDPGLENNDGLHALVPPQSLSRRLWQRLDHP